MSSKNFKNIIMRYDAYVLYNNVYNIQMIRSSNKKI